MKNKVNIILDADQTTWVERHYILTPVLMALGVNAVYFTITAIISTL